MSKSFYDIGVAVESTMVETVPVLEFNDHELTQIGTDVSDDMYALEQLFVYSDELLGYKSVAEESLKNNLPLSPVSSQLLSTAIESMRSRLNMADRNTIPSLEAFESKHSNISATRIAVEGIGTVFAKIWEFIASIFTRLRDNIKKFFSLFYRSSNNTAEKIRQEQAKFNKESKERYNRQYEEWQKKREEDNKQWNEDSEARRKRRQKEYEDAFNRHKGSQYKSSGFKYDSGSSDSNSSTGPRLTPDQDGVDAILQAFSYKGKVDYDSIPTLLNNNERVISFLSSIIDLLESHFSNLESKEGNSIIINEIISKRNSSFTEGANGRGIRTSAQVGFSKVYEFNIEENGGFKVELIDTDIVRAKYASKLTTPEIEKSLEVSLKYAEFLDKVYGNSKEKTNKLVDNLNGLITKTKRNIDSGNISPDLETETVLTKSFLRFMSNYISSYEDFKRVNSMAAKYRKLSKAA